MNNCEMYNELKGLEMIIKSEIEIKEEPIENYLNEGFCDEENLDSDSLRIHEQTKEISSKNSSFTDPNVPVKFEDDIYKRKIELDSGVKIEYSLLDVYERKTENINQDECAVKREGDCEEGVPEDSEDVPPDTGNELENKLINTKININEWGEKSDNTLSFNSSKVQNKIHKTINLKKNERIASDEIETQEGPISNTFRKHRVRDMKNQSLMQSKTNLFKCSECDYSCNQKDNLKIHSLTHLNTKLFTCSLCDYKSNWKGAIKRHLLTHSEIKQFKCFECDYESNDKGYLKKHSLKHSITKRLECSESECATNWNGDISPHLLTHSDTKVFECSECDYTSDRKETLDRHFTSHLTYSEMYKRIRLQNNEASKKFRTKKKQQQQQQIQELMKEESRNKQLKTQIDSLELNVSKWKKLVKSICF